MPARKSAKRKTVTPETLYRDFFAAVEKRGFFALTLPEIARATGMKLGDLLAEFPDRNALLIGFGRFIDRQLAESEAEEDAASLKEKLFDLSMRRFELLQKYRGGIARLMDDMLHNPVGALFLLCEIGIAMRGSMRLMLELAGFPLQQCGMELAATGLKLVYLQALRAWKNDESADLSATMAALDRGLDRFISLTGTR